MKKNLLVIVVAIILGIVIGIIIRQERVKPLNQEPDTGIKSVNPKDIADAEAGGLEKTDAGEYYEQSAETASEIADSTVSQEVKIQTTLDADAIKALYKQTIADYDEMMHEGELAYESRSGYEEPDRYTYYAIADIDNNGVDELILRYDFLEQKQLTSTNDGYAETTYVYTVIDDNVVEVLPAGSRLPGYTPTIIHEGYIRIYKGTNLINCGFSREPRDDQFYRYQDGILGEAPEVTMTHGSGTWIINGEAKSQDECERLYNQLRNGGEGYELQLYERPESLEENKIIPADETIVVAGGYEAPKSDFIFWFSSERTIDMSELDKMTPTGTKDVDIASMSEADKQIRLNVSQVAIDEIYARHGMTVADSDNPSPADLYAREYLYSLDWYRKANAYYLSGNKTELSDIEKDNISLLYHWQHQYWDAEGYVSPYAEFRN